MTQDDKHPRPGLWLWIGLMAAAGLSVWALSRWFPDQTDSADRMSIVYTLSILAVASSGLLFLRHINLKQAARNILLWLGVAVVLLLGYSFQDVFTGAATRLRSEVMPGYPVQASAQEMVLSEREGGGYFLYATVDGRQVPFLVDTGATDIVLSPGDARRLGVDFSRLKFHHAYETANGRGYGARYRIASLTVGNMTLTDVPVSINQAEMRTSLLGMAFLRQLKSFEIRDRKLIMRQ